MAAHPMVVVEQSLEERIDVVIEDYVVDLGRRYAGLYGEDGARLHSEKLQEDLGQDPQAPGGDATSRSSDMHGRGVCASVAGSGTSSCTGSG